MSVPPADDVQTPSAQVHGAKLQHFFDMCKINAKKIALYSTI